MKRLYFTKIVGDGSAGNPCRTIIEDLVGCNYSAEDLRPTSTGPGYMYCIADVTDAQHAIVAAHPDVDYLPIEDAAGNIPQTIGEITPANRATLKTLAEKYHVSIDDISLADPVSIIHRRIIRRRKIMECLGIIYSAATGSPVYNEVIDFDEVLDNKLSSIPPSKRNKISARLTDFGFDVSGLTGGTTVREALRLLCEQNNRHFSL